MQERAPSANETAISSLGATVSLAIVFGSVLTSGARCTRSGACADLGIDEVDGRLFPVGEGRTFPALLDTLAEEDGLRLEDLCSLVRDDVAVKWVEDDTAELGVLLSERLVAVECVDDDIAELGFLLSERLLPVAVECVDDDMAALDLVLSQRLRTSSIEVTPSPTSLDFFLELAGGGPLAFIIAATSSKKLLVSGFFIRFFFLVSNLLLPSAERCDRSLLDIGLDFCLVRRFLSVESPARRREPPLMAILIMPTSIPFAETLVLFGVPGHSV